MKSRRINLSTFFDGVNANLAKSALPINTARKSYNFCHKSGALKTGLGANFMRVKNKLSGVVEGEPGFLWMRMPPATEPAGVYHYRFYDPADGYTKKHKLVMIGTNKRVYQMDVPTMTANFDNSFSQIMVEEMPKNILNYRLKNRDVLIMCFENEPMHIYDASLPENERLYVVENAPKMISMCLHFERLFAVVSGHRNAVWFSQELDPTMWNISLQGAGFIEMIDERGELTKVVSFENHVYIFREYGIARLTGFADQTQFQLNQLFTSSGRIYEDTVTICGDRILFLAEDGLYVFDGLTTRKISTGIESLLTEEKNKSARGIFYNSKYYLACYLNFGDEVAFGCEWPEVVAAHGKPKNNALIEIDLTTSRLSITRGFDIRFLNTINETDYSQLVFCVGGMFNMQVWEIFNSYPNAFYLPMHRLWLSPRTDLGLPGKKKTIKSVSLITKTQARLTMRSDSGEFVINLPGSQDKQTVPCMARGREFEFEFFRGRCLS